MWKMVPSYVLWCCGRKIMIEVLRTVRGLLKSFFICLFYTLYLGTVAFVNPLVISHHDFIVLFSLFS